MWWARTVFDPARICCREIPAPTGVTEMRAFHGLCQHVRNFSGTLVPFLRPLAPLLQKDFVWEWTEQHKKDFKAARESLSPSSELSFYNTALSTLLHVDASHFGALVSSSDNKTAMRAGKSSRRDPVSCPMQSPGTR
jgi:hypothetical protein